MTVLSVAPSKNDHAFWNCRCDCGNDAVVSTHHLKDGSSSSCGCLAKSLSRERNYATREDLTGRRFGSYTVIEFSRSISHPDSGGTVYWRCQCDCGEVNEVQAGALRRKSDIKCRKCADLDLLIDDPHYHLNQIYSRYRANAKTRSIPFEITQNEIEELIKLPCYYCGKPPSNQLHMCSNRETFLYNGVDRVDSKKPYRLDNCVPCCWDCNLQKGTKSAEVFLSQLRAK